MGFFENAREQAEAQKAARAAIAQARPHSGVHYHVEIVREKMIGDHVGHEKLEDLLNSHAAEGWLLKSIVKTDVAGRIGGGTGGLMIVFERPVAA